MRRNVSPFFSYFGGKVNNVHHYPAPRHGTIVEPFAGAAGYSTHYPYKEVVLVEKNPEIAELWRWLIRSTAKDILALPLVFEDLREIDLEPGAKAFIGFWCNAATTRAGHVPSAWCRGGTRPSSFWGVEVRSRIARQIKAISHWRVIEGDYSLGAEVGEATWFVDPPYHKSGVAYPCSAKKLDFPALGDWCKERVGQVIVCEQVGADWLPFQPLANFRGTGRKGPRGSKEVVWLSDGTYRRKQQGLGLV